MRYDADVTDAPPPAARPPVQTRQDVEDRVAELAPVLRALGVERVRLFGSFARGDQTDNSDVDLLVHFRPSDLTFDNLFDAAETFERELGRPADVLTPGGLSPHIGPHILREARDVSLAA